MTEALRASPFRASRFGTGTSSTPVPLGMNAKVIPARLFGFISGGKTVEQLGEEILEFVVRVASGEQRTKAESLGQDDFIPWKRGVSL